MLTPGSIYFNVVGISSFKHKNTIMPATVHFQLKIHGNFGVMTNYNEPKNSPRASEHCIK